MLSLYKMYMRTDKYSIIWVEKPLHYEIKVFSAKEKKTMNEFLAKLVKDYKKKKGL